MTSKNVAARIIKLEARRSRPDEVLLVWRRPGADVSMAVSGAKFSAGDKVICAEWFGNNPLPAPKWYRERLSSKLGAVENEYLTRSLERVSDDRPRDPRLAQMPGISGQRMKELTDNELLHLAFGVAT